jgi:trehalose-phosphatase
MKQSAIKGALDLIPALSAAREKSSRLLVGLDFDGTLARIVPTPAEAALIDGAYDVLQALAARADTVVAIVTGRGVADVRGRVRVEGIHFAGNHGLEISGPGVEWVHPDASAARPAIEALLERLGRVLGGIDGIILEDKIVSMSVHFRTVVDPGLDQRIVQLVHETAAEIGGPIRLTDGKKVVEVRPAVDWDKGRAFVYLRDRLVPAAAPAIFIGDDRTDEDAFREVLQPPDAGIIVGTSRLDETRATAMLQSPGDVVRFLERLAA